MNKSHHFSRVRACLTLLTVLIALTSNTKAALLTYQGSGSNPDGTILTGCVLPAECFSSSPMPYYNTTSPVTYSAVTTVDTDNFTLTLDSLSMSFEGFSYSYTESFTTGFGETADVVTTINYDPISLSFYDAGSLSLTPTTGGDFDVEVASMTQPVNLSGSYQIAGPAESVSGLFSFSLSPTMFVGLGSLNTLNYPQSTTLSPVSIYSDSSYPFIYENILYDVYVDGFHFVNSHNFLGISTTNPLTLNAVPLPPALWLFGFGLIGLIGISRRKKAA